MNDIKISIIICTMNRCKDLSACLTSVGNQTNLPHEIVIVDASSDYTSKELIKNYRYKIKSKLIYIKTEPGLTQQRNIGINRSTGDIIAFLDDDVVLNNNFLKSMSKCFSENKNIYGATGHILNLGSEKKIAKVIRNLFLLPSSGKTGRMKRSGFANFVNPKQKNKLIRTQILSGCNMLFRRKVFDDNKFDEKFDGYGLMEDVEFSFRVSKKYDLLFVKNSKLFHNRSKSERINLDKYFEMLVFNHYYIFTKNIEQNLINWILFIWSEIGMVIRCLFWVLKTGKLFSLKGFILGHLRILNNKF